jgi:hypothetical protein
MSAWLKNVETGDLGHASDRIKNLRGYDKAGNTHAMIGCITRKLDKHKLTESAVCARKAYDGYTGTPLQGDYAWYLTQGWRASTYTHKKNANGQWVVHGDDGWSGSATHGCPTLQKFTDKKEDCFVTGKRRDFIINKVLAKDSNLTDEQKSRSIFNTAQHTKYDEFVMQGGDISREQRIKDRHEICVNIKGDMVDNPKKPAKCEVEFGVDLTSCEYGRTMCWAFMGYNQKHWYGCVDKGTDCSTLDKPNDYWKNHPAIYKGSYRLEKSMACPVDKHLCLYRNGPNTDYKYPNVPMICLYSYGTSWNVENLNCYLNYNGWWAMYGHSQVQPYQAVNPPTG